NAGLVLAIAGVIGAGAVLFRQWNLVRDDGAMSTLTGAVRVDTFGIFLGVVVLAATVMALLLSASYMKRENLDAPEYYALMLLSAAGMLIMTTATDTLIVSLSR